MPGSPRSWLSKAGRVRLFLVADEIPSELPRVVEFLNEQPCQLGS
jgi:hypothetical protein